MKDNETEQQQPSADETVADVGASAAAGAPLAASVEVEQVKDRLLRLQADFDNYRKRAARERSEWQVFAIEQVIRDLLPVVDHYELGLAVAAKNQTPPAVMDGFKLVYEQLLGVLKKQGVTPLAVAPGTPFDPHQHEAISHLPSEEHAADVVMAETRRGYKLGDKLLRPLQVVVSSGPPAIANGDGK